MAAAPKAQMKIQSQLDLPKSKRSPNSSGATSRPGVKTHSRERTVYKKNRKSEPQRKPAILPAAEQSELILAHLESAGKFAWALLNRWRITLPLDEVKSIAGAALCEAASRFDSALGVNFKTFFFYHLRGLLLRDISRRVGDQRMRVSSEHVESLTGVDEAFELNRKWPSAFVNHDNPESLLAREEIRDALQRACDSLDPMSREIVLRCFVQGETVSSIARELGYCRCHVSRMKTKALRDLAIQLRPVLGDLPVQSMTDDDDTNGRGMSRAA